MTKEEILKYVMQSPENTNPNVLKGMLDQLDNGGGSSDFSIAEVQVQIHTKINSYSVAIIDEGKIMITEEFGNGTFEVPIYKNGSIMYLDPGLGNVVVATTTGDIIYNSDYHYFLITGNGTITISGGK